MNLDYLPIIVLCCQTYLHGCNAIHEPIKKKNSLDKLNKKMPWSREQVTQARRIFLRPRLKNHETIYEMYWKGGEKYMKRTMKVRRKVRTRAPPPTNASLSPTATFTFWTGEGENTRITPYVNYQCQHPCPLIFEQYGTVCGQRFNGIKYETLEFHDACELFESNCVDHNQPNSLDKHRGPWYILYRGKCRELTTPFVYNPTNVTEIVARVEQHMKYVTANDPFIKGK